jgi:2-phospho-L-lactate guanylyltransferase (CobY/MobA/RfbA family)
MDSRQKRLGLRSLVRNSAKKILPNADMKVSALLPVKGFRNAKQRLSPLLGAADRELLAEAMFRDVLREVTRARGLEATFVVTGNERVAEIAARMGAAVIREPAETGETGAVDFARLELKRAGREAVLILPGDMPLVHASDIEQVLPRCPGARRHSRCWSRPMTVWEPMLYCSRRLT